MNDNLAVKFVGDSNDTIEGWLAPFGGPDYLGGKDWHGEFFAPSTDFALDWFSDWQRPLLYQHGLDGAIKTDVVGRIKVEVRDKGLWMQAQLDASHEYHDEIAKMVGSGALGASSGSVGHLVQTDRKSGEIKRWPLIEGSLTPTPANPQAHVGYAIKSVDAVKHLAIIGSTPPAKFSEAAADASQASYVLGSLISMLGDETDPADAALLRTALDAILAYLGAETAEIGTPEDVAESMLARMAYASKSGARHSAADMTHIQSAHDAMRALGATCTPENATASKSEAAPTAPEPAAMSFLGIKASEPIANAADVDATRDLLSAYAVKVALDLLR